jgi:hypothetical protein
MIIYLDTNILVKENFLRSIMAETLLKSCRFLDIAIMIPEVVIDETIGNFNKQVQKLSSELNKLNKNYDLLLGEKVNSIDVEEKNTRYFESLNKKINDYGVDILEYPTITPKELVESSYTAKKPFKNNGDGYKDYIVWETIKDNIILNGNSFKYFFLNNNIKDFSDGFEGSKKLHNDLVSQLPKNIDVTLQTSIKEFYDQIISPKLTKIEFEDIPNISKYDIETEVERLLHSELFEYDAFGFSGHYTNDITIVDTGDIFSEKILIEKIGKDSLYIKINGEISVDMHGFIDKFDYYSNYDELQNIVFMIDSDYNDHVCFVNEIAELPFEASFIYSEKSGERNNESFTLTSEIKHDYL